MPEAVPSPRCAPKTAPAPTRWLRFKDTRLPRRLSGRVFEPIGNIDVRHDIAGSGREPMLEGGDGLVVIGSDVGVIAGDGRLRNVYGFLDKVPAT